MYSNNPSPTGWYHPLPYKRHRRLFWEFRTSLRTYNVLSFQHSRACPSPLFSTLDTLLSRVHSTFNVVRINHIDSIIAIIVIAATVAVLC